MFQCQEGDPDCCYKSLPMNRSLSVGQSKIADGGEGIWADVIIPIGTWFGPYQVDTLST